MSPLLARMSLWNVCKLIDSCNWCACICLQKQVLLSLSLSLSLHLLHLLNSSSATNNNQFLFTTPIISDATSHLQPSNTIIIATFHANLSFQYDRYRAQSTPTEIAVVLNCVELCLFGLMVLGWQYLQSYLFFVELLFTQCFQLFVQTLDIGHIFLIIKLPIRLIAILQLHTETISRCEIQDLAVLSNLKGNQ